MTLLRVTGWRKRLERATDAIRRTPFAWGGHDCISGLIAPAVLAITGVDVGARWRGRYTSEFGALRVLKEDGFSDLADLVASFAPPQHVSRARIGDIAAFESGDAFGYSLGIVNGERVIVLRPEGLGSLDLLQAVKSFRIG